MHLDVISNQWKFRKKVKKGKKERKKERKIERKKETGQIALAGKTIFCCP